MKVEIKQGEALTVELEGTDGTFIITYGNRILSVRADMPDTKGRVGVIYAEKFGQAMDEINKTMSKEEIAVAGPATQALQDLRALGKVKS